MCIFFLNFIVKCHHDSHFSKYHVLGQIIEVSVSHIISAEYSHILNSKFLFSKIS